MKKFYIHLLGVFLLNVIIEGNDAKAQLIDGKAILQHNQLTGNLLTVGNSFSSFGTNFGLKLNPNKPLISATGLWLANKSANSLKTAGSLGFGLNQNYDFFPGPIDILTRIGANYTFWDVVWGVTKTEIENHKLLFNQVGYVIPSSILYWPGNGFGTIQQKVAPFVDVNNNGIYEPILGDYPNVKGDKAYFTVFNDNFNSHLNFGGQPLIAEVRCLVYVFNNTQYDYLKNSIFIDYEVVNRSTSNLDSLYFGLWNDFDIGDPSDDFVGTDVNRRMIYAYNGDSFDNPVPAFTGFGTTPPAVGTIFLNQPLSKSIHYVDGSNVASSQPINAIQLSRALEGKWIDGTALTFGGNGYDPSGTPTNYSYPDTTGGIGQNWSMVSEGNTPADYKMLGTSGPISLNSDSSLKVQVVYTYARDLNGNNITSLDKLKNQADEIIAFYNNGLTSSLPTNLNSNVEFGIYPNPASNQFIINLNTISKEKFDIEIVDMKGMIVQQFRDVKNFPFIINGSGLANGVYNVNLKTKQTVSNKRIIIAR